MKGRYRSTGTGSKCQNVFKDITVFRCDEAVSNRCAIVQPLVQPLACYTTCIFLSAASSNDLLFCLTFRFLDLAVLLALVWGTCLAPAFYLGMTVLTMPLVVEAS